MTVLAAGDVSPGLLGFVVVALIGLALYILIKSMNKQMSKIQVPHEGEAERIPVPHEGDAARDADEGADKKAE
ncbi:MAG: hypothetical protein HOV96_19495 [Nonomuraea sp.]|nr:hypothetical protein [Nonomuraea sp.]NUP67194.1 hypothetical protein [Nonomuraea sp.]NUP79726.1 hypothetical protein [Nonomuraea sp.]NUS03124.1 hypothetical protein [Nonomuraea sp.]NUT12096.1 hypothetical protein [Nonomuraea sp.]